jgi:serine O-acetyltransferase
VVSDQAVIGSNVNISQGITIGRTNRGEKQGVPTIGDEVYIGPGAKIIGKINIGNNITIGANAVVTSDIPNNACVAGIPAKIISYAGSEGYVNRKV